MEEAQYSEDLFSTQDEAAFEKANSKQQAPVDKIIEEHEQATPPVHEKEIPSTAENQVHGSVEQDTPDLEFSEDIDFGKEIAERENNSSDRVAAVLEDFDEPIEPDEIATNADERIDSEEAVESSVPNPKTDNASSSKETPEERLAQFPFARIKQMMKLDPDVGIVSAEAIFLVTKAAELFLQTLAKDTSSHTLASKKKTMSKRDVELAIDSVDSLVFLEGMMNV